MPAILVEPSKFCFELNYIDYTFNNKEEEIQNLKDYLMHLSEFFISLSKNNIKVALTAELYKLYQEMIPHITYYNKSINETSYRLYNRLLMKNGKIVPNVDKYFKDVMIEYDNIDVSGIYNFDIYKVWLKMFVLINAKILPPWIFTSDEKTIFNENYIYIINENGKKIKVFIENNLDLIASSDEVSMFRFIETFTSPNTELEVPCSGTGTHSSMWDKSIKKISDIPNFERELIKELIRTGLIKHITFLAFPIPIAAQSDPSIEIKSIESADSSDILMCILKGKGKKQNCQEIRVEVHKGWGKVLEYIFDGDINIDKLRNLYYIIQESII